MPKRGLMLWGVNFDRIPISSQGNTARKIFFNGDQITLWIGGQINNAKASRTQRLLDAVIE